jgi:hypothetical protein
MSHFDICSHGNPEEKVVDADLVTIYLAHHVESQIDDLFASPRFLAMEKPDQIDGLAMGGMIGVMRSIYKRTRDTGKRRELLLTTFNSAVIEAIDAIEAEASAQEPRH